jgi:hypothetical protein
VSAGCWLLRSCCPFGVAVGWYSPPGLTGVNPGHSSIARPLSCPILGKPIPYVGLVFLTMVQLYLCLRYPWRPACRDGFVRVETDLRYFPLSGLMISRYRREVAVPRSLRVGDCTQRRTASCQGSEPCHPSPRLYRVSGERIALKFRINWRKFSGYLALCGHPLRPIAELHVTQSTYPLRHRFLKNQHCGKLHFTPDHYLERYR